MDMPRGLIVIIGLLALGMCWDVAILVEGGAALWIGIVLLAGRIAAIVGIILRTRLGWWLAIGFFGVILALNLLATGIPDSPVIAIPLFLPVICLGYLVMARDEFE